MTTSRTFGKAALLAAALGLLGGSAALAQTAAPSGMATMPGMSAGPVTPSTTLNDTDKLFMLRSAQGDMAEISTSQMALKKAKSGEAKQVAQTLIMGHSASLKEGMGLAVLLGLPAPKGPTVPDMAVAKQLSAASGKEFDKLYLAGQQVDHENTIALFGMELSQGQDPQVKAFAAKYLPGIEGHTAQIYQAALSVSAPDSTLRPTTPPMVTGVAPASMADMNSTSGMSGSMGTSTPGTSTPGTGSSPATPGQ